MAIIRILGRDETRAASPRLCEILADCVNGGASVGFMLPFAPADGEAYWREVGEAVGESTTIHAVAEVDGDIVGTVQVGLAMKPNQRHRGEVMKLMVHSSARGRGLSRKLMERIEAEAVSRNLTLLVLDTSTGSEAEAVYPRLGWSRVGTIPDYALSPDGRACGTTLFYKRLA